MTSALYSRLLWKQFTLCSNLVGNMETMPSLSSRLQVLRVFHGVTIIPSIRILCTVFTQALKYMFHTSTSVSVAITGTCLQTDTHQILVPGPDEGNKPVQGWGHLAAGNQSGNILYIVAMMAVKLENVFCCRKTLQKDQRCIPWKCFKPVVTQCLFKVLQD